MSTKISKLDSENLINQVVYQNSRQFSDDLFYYQQNIMEARETLHEPQTWNG